MLFKIWNEYTVPDSSDETRIWNMGYPFPAYPTRKDLENYGAIFHRQNNKIATISLFIESWEWNGEDEVLTYSEFVFNIKRLD